MKNTIKLEDFQVTLQRKISPKGTKFVHFYKPGAPIAITISSRSGSRFDPPGKSGLAHFVEHVVLDGTEKYKNKKDLSLCFDDLGASYSASTGPEYTKFDFLIAKKEHLNFVADVVDQIFSKPLLSQKSIDLEKKIIKTEVSSKLDNNKRVLSNNMKKLMYGDNCLAYNISGTEESIETINKDDLLSHLKNVFFQDMTVVSCGSCDVEDIYTLFDPVINNEKQSHTLTTPQISIGTKHGSFKMADQKLIYCMFTFPTCGMSSDDDVALNVLSAYLGRRRSSLLSEILRYDEGLLYSVTSGNSRFSGTGYFFIKMAMKKENLPTVFNKIKEVLETLQKNGIPKEALGVIKNKVVNAGIISTQTVQFWADTQFYRELLLKDNNYYYADYLNEISTISKGEVDRVVNKYMSFDKMFFYAVGNVEEGEIDSLFNFNNE
ncbi:MAG: peptidase M16 protein [uncultured bacterium]|nr:MAG: peptidase M16 protein [uncultured bacterium]